jgi:hypothetical protein
MSKVIYVSICATCPFAGRSQLIMGVQRAEPMCTYGNPPVNAILAGYPVIPPECPLEDGEPEVRYALAEDSE